MAESIRFHSDLYRRDAVRDAAQKFARRATFELTDVGPEIVVTAKPGLPPDDVVFDQVRGEFLNEALSATARKLRGGGDPPRSRGNDAAGAGGPPWELLSPFREGTSLALGWALGALSPIRSGGATLELRHAEMGGARLAIRRNLGTPRGVAHTHSLDFILQNGGNGSARTESSLGRVLLAFAAALDERHDAASDTSALAALLPLGAPAPTSTRGGTTDEAHAEAPRRISPRLDLAAATVAFEFDDSRIERLPVYDAILSFTDRCHVFLTRPTANVMRLELSAPRGDGSSEALKGLARDVTKALNRVGGRASRELPHSVRAVRPGDRGRLDALLAELEVADPTTVGLGFVPRRGPEHENLRVLNIRGTGACNSDCVFCVEKFDPSHRSTPNADATRQMILGAEHQFDLLFFASGEPTIHPKLFEYVELAKTVGFTSFGMSSHFRTLADPRFTLKILTAGFRYFDISLHAADSASQLDVNPIGDDGRSLHEALKGLAVLYRLADALGLPISVTQKIVVSRLNVLRLEEILRATYDRGVRHFILQPVKTFGLAPDLQAKLTIEEHEAIPYLNELLRNTEALGAVIKPYGFSRQGLVPTKHLETEQNRVKNMYGRAGVGIARRAVAPSVEQRPTDGRHWVEIRLWRDTHDGADAPRKRWAFASDGNAPILDEALDRGMDASFGCRMGSCGMCAAKLIEGQIDQSGQIFLGDDQIRAGYVLLCQAKALTDVVLESCTDAEIDAL